MKLLRALLKFNKINIYLGLAKNSIPNLNTSITKTDTAN